MEEKMEEMGENTKFLAQQVIEGQNLTKKLTTKLEELKKILKTKIPNDQEKIMELFQKLANAGGGGGLSKQRNGKQWIHNDLPGGECSQ